jgi:hypothetical protein
MADEPPDALRRLEERLSRASDAAERLIAEAARTDPRDRPPPAGWQAPPRDDDDSRARGASEVEALMQALQALRELIPPDVLDRLAAALREVLLAIRALIDFYLERIERRPAEPVEVQDIPID